MRRRSYVKWGFVMAMLLHSRGYSQPLDRELLHHALELIEDYQGLGNFDYQATKSALENLDNSTKSNKRDFAAVLLKSARATRNSAVILSRALSKIGQQILPSRESHRFLEDVDSVEALTWTREQSQRARDILASHPLFEEVTREQVAIQESTDRIPMPVFGDDDLIYNFWTDGNHEDGFLRRTTLESYRGDNPQWETILDFDALNAREGKKWVYKGSSRLAGSNKMLIMLSPDGGDAVEYREFDLVSLTFVEDGFYLESAKQQLGWIDENTVLLMTAADPADATLSGYPRTVKIWQRGTSPVEAKIIFEGARGDVSVNAGVIHHKDQDWVYIAQATSFFETHKFLWIDGSLTELDLPLSAELIPVETKDTNHPKGLAFLRLKGDLQCNGQQFTSGSLLKIWIENGAVDWSKADLLREPGDGEAIEQVLVAKNHIIVGTNENVQSRAYRYTIASEHAYSEEIALPKNVTGEVYSINRAGTLAFLNYEGYLLPTTLSIYDIEANALSVIKQRPASFDASAYQVEQLFATSADGTRVPYSILSPKEMEGPLPTVIYGYGGFEISLTPGYSNSVEAGWLRLGGRYVIANIRGGGEFGPSWHESAKGPNRHRAYQDFIAIAEDLVSRGLATPEQIGIYGGSNGGLLTGAILSMRPDLIAAAIIAVPLLDMIRYPKLLAGHSWIGEYGDPEISRELAHLELISPYHNIDPMTSYPAPLLTTSKADNRVHPGHARKFAYQLEEFGQSFLFFESERGGHGFANPRQRAEETAMRWIYFYMRLVEKKDI